MASPPDGLREEEIAVYDKLLAVRARREREFIAPPQIIVITDIGKDQDDLPAIMVLAELHRLGLVRLLGAIANSKPQLRRARLLRGVLDELGLWDVPVGIGTAGGPGEHVVRLWEFPLDGFMTRHTRFEDGKILLKRLLFRAASEGEKVSLVLISPLRDANLFVREHALLFKLTVGHVFMQGGCYVGRLKNPKKKKKKEDGEKKRKGEEAPSNPYEEEAFVLKLRPDPLASNNKADIVCAAAFHTFLEEMQIPSTAYTSLAAYACALPSKSFDDLQATQHPLGMYLQDVRIQQDLYYWGMYSGEESERDRKDLGPSWFLRTRTSWFSTHGEHEPYPIGDELIPYLDRVILYDALAALGAAGKDVARAMGLGHSTRIDPSGHHSVVGFDKDDVGLDPELVVPRLSAVLRGSLLATGKVGWAVGRYRAHAKLADGTGRSRRSGAGRRMLSPNFLASSC